MFIKELEISNFKSFNGSITPIVFNIPNGTLGSGLNIFVGENNTGKSTAFEAIDFVRNGTKKNTDDIKNKNNPDCTHAQVTLTFIGNVNETIDSFAQDNKKAVFKKYPYQDNNGDFLFKISRSTDEVKNVLLWDNTAQKYKNESGIDAPIKKMFEANFVWADTNPNDEAAFGSTTICGNLLKEIVNGFVETEDYGEFKTKFNQIFNHDDSGLRKELLQIEQRVQAIFSDQFGDATIKFHFDELKIESFFKNTTIRVNDGINTSMDEKGNGMQRAVVLALLQVYAEELTKHPDDDNLKKPFYLFIDEPEICLHPKGQEKLLKALLEISKTRQVFLTTHSPYFLISNHLKNIGLYIFTKNGDSSHVESVTTTETIDKLFPWSPTWGEINFKAYKLPTVEFHNELYGYLQEKNNKSLEREFETWITTQGIRKSKRWTKEKRDGTSDSYDVSLQTFIRNKIHHPENTTMQSDEYTAEELTQSIEEMLNLFGNR